MFNEEALYIDEEDVHEFLRDTMDSSDLLKNVPVYDVVDEFKDEFFDEIEKCYTLTVSSYHEWINDKVLEIIDETLKDMVKEGTIEMGPNEDGEIVFWAPDKKK